MRNDADEELKRLEEALAQEENGGPEEMGKTIVFPAQSQTREVKVHSTDCLDVDLEAFSREVETPAGRRGKGLLAVLFVLLTGVFLCVLLWWLKMRGIIG